MLSSPLPKFGFQVGMALIDQDPTPESSISMHLPPLLSQHDNHFYIRGNVSIHPHAAIAPGVVLQADAESEIVIAAGVCIGMGSVLHAYQGKLEVQEAATLGAGVLWIGRGQIGAHASIGARTTIFNHSIAAEAVIPPGSVIGDESRPVLLADLETNPLGSAPELQSEGVSNFHPPTNQAPQAVGVSSIGTQSSVANPTVFNSTSPNPTAPDPTVPELTAPDSPVAESTVMGNGQPRQGPVAGQASLDRLMVMLFPHRRPLENSPQGSSPASGDTLDQ